MKWLQKNIFLRPNIIVIVIIIIIIFKKEKIHKTKVTTRRIQDDEGAATITSAAECTLSLCNTAPKNEDPKGEEQQATK